MALEGWEPLLDEGERLAAAGARVRGLVREAVECEDEYGKALGRYAVASMAADLDCAEGCLARASSRWYQAADELAALVLRYRQAEAAADAALSRLAARRGKEEP